MNDTLAGWLDGWLYGFPKCMSSWICRMNEGSDEKFLIAKIVG